jgi:hypothetical protein
LTVALTPGTLFSLRSIRLAQEAQVIPVSSSSMLEVPAPGRGDWPDD